MKTNLIIISTFILTFVFLFLTSFLFDLEVIYRSKTRSILVILLLITEFIVGFLSLKSVVNTHKTGKKQNKNA